MQTSIWTFFSYGNIKTTPNILTINTQTIIWNVEKKLISIKPISNIEHLNKVIHRKEIYEERSIEQVNRKLFWYYCTKCLFIVIWIAMTIKLNLFQYVVIGIMALIATLRVDTAKTMMFVIKWQAAVLEDVRCNGWEIDVMVGLMMKMKIYTPYQKPL